MPAEEKSIDIKLKMDISELRKNLKAIPGMTKEEARKMTMALQRELKQTQAAAKKAAAATKAAKKKELQETKAAARQAAALAKQEAAAHHALQKSMQDDLKKTGMAARNARKQSREMGAAFGSLEDVVGEISPELQGLTTTIGTLGQAGRALSRSLATGNPVVLALVAGIAALAAGYHLLTSASREAERQQKLLNEANEQSAKKYSDQAGLIRAIAADQNAAIREQKVLMGAMTEAEKERLDLEDQIAAKTQSQIDKQLEHVENQKQLVKLAKKAGDSSSQLTEEETKQLELGMKLSKLESVRTGLAGTQAGISTQMMIFKNELLKGLQKEEFATRRIKAENDKTLSILKENIAAREELRQEQEEEDRRQERIRQAREAAQKRRAELERIQNALMESQKNSAQNIKTSQISLLEGEDKINAQYAMQVQKLEEKKDLLLDEAIKAQDIARTQKEKSQAQQMEIEAGKAIAALTEEQTILEEKRLKEVDELRAKLSEKEQKRLEQQEKKQKQLQKERITEIKEGIQASISGLQTFTTAGMELMEATGTKNKTLLNVLFRANQAAAIANIAMSTAEAMAKALSLGPAAPAAQAVILAGAAAQTGIVLAQQPPIAHMGGFIKPLSPGEQTRTVLEGEAVLDRATTRRIGGEAGVRALQEGRSGNQEVIVLSPYKHLDRYNRSALKNRRSALGAMLPASTPRF